MLNLRSVKHSYKILQSGRKDVAPLIREIAIAEKTGVYKPAVGSNTDKDTLKSIMDAGGESRADATGGQNPSPGGAEVGADPGKV